jgi:hypothetical protein
MPYIGKHIHMAVYRFPVLQGIYFLFWKEYINVYPFRTLMEYLLELLFSNSANYMLTVRADKFQLGRWLGETVLSHQSWFTRLWRFLFTLFNCHRLAKTVRGFWTRCLENIWFIGRMRCFMPTYHTYSWLYLNLVMQSLLQVRKVLGHSLLVCKDLKYHHQNSLEIYHETKYLHLFIIAGFTRFFSRDNIKEK